MADMDRSAMEQFFAKRKEDDAAFTMSLIKTQIRNAITSLEEGDEEEALEILKNLVGKD